MPQARKLFHLISRAALRAFSLPILRLRKIQGNLLLWRSKMESPIHKIRGYIERNCARAFFRRPVAIRTNRPLISFTFDDFPQSALFVGGAILKRFGLRGTYYVSLGLAGQDSPSGRIVSSDQLKH